MAHDNVLPIEFADFDKMCSEGDTLFVGRYLTNGADVSSVYMDVSLPLKSTPCLLKASVSTLCGLTSVADCLIVCWEITNLQALGYLY